MHLGTKNLTTNKQDLLIAKAVCLQVTVVGIKNMLVQAVPFLYAINSTLNMILLAIIGAIYVRTFVYMKKRIAKFSFGILCFVLVSFVFTLLVFPENTMYIESELPRVLPYCFITFFMISQIKEISILENYMERYSIIIIVFSVLSASCIFVIGHITTSTWDTYSMPLSYVTMLAVMWLLHRYFKEEKARWLLIAMLGIIVILAYGSRNPLLAIISYVIVNIIKKVFVEKTQHKFKYLLFAVVGCIGLLFWRDVLNLIINILANFNVVSRSLTLLTEKTLNTTGRTEIHEALRIALKNSPVLGYGVLGDKVVLASSHMEAHSLYLSILSNYGYCVGCLIIILLIIWNVKSYRLGKHESREILLIYMCMVWPRGFTGGDVWTSDVFWWMLGIIASIIEYGYRKENL